jgi:alkanesulfonate monooxygenase SsuD/methylene tetrahydromethanopterin reductase-like flavin-dependent oxidoreductase (luciferase family)
MRYGFVLPGGTATEQLELAVLADQSGWDGVFVWEAAFGVDPWTLMAAMAVRTTRVRLGTLLTPIPWRRPWKLASQVVTLDQLSNGRAIVAVGLGAVDNALGNTGEELDRRRRADMMDEGIDLMAGLFEGKLKFEGQHYTMDLSPRTDIARVARPVQKPRPPIWVVGVWPRMKSMRRVLRCDGILPAVMPPSPDQFGTPKPADIRAIREWLTEQGKPAGFDIISEGETPADDAARAREQVAPWEEAGCTWWLETRWSDPGDQGARGDEVRRRIDAGPPRV